MTAFPQVDISLREVKCAWHKDGLLPRIPLRWCRLKCHVRRSVGSAKNHLPPSRSRTPLAVRSRASICAQKSHDRKRGRWQVAVAPLNPRATSGSRYSSERFPPELVPPQQQGSIVAYKSYPEARFRVGMPNRETDAAAKATGSDRIFQLAAQS